MKKELTAKRLRELFCYDPEIGIFTRRISAGGRNGKKFPAGIAVGSKGTLGYLEVGIDGNSYLLHRLAWLYVHGEKPTQQIDHINGVRHDNRIANLRQVDNTTNIENRQRANKNNRTSGLLGAHRCVGSRKWVAQIMVNRKSIPLGRFDTAEEAHSAYVEAKRRLHRGCTL